jgi:hypothetical protein
MFTQSWACSFSYFSGYSMNMFTWMHEHVHVNAWTCSRECMNMFTWMHEHVHVNAWTFSCNKQNYSSKTIFSFSLLNELVHAITWACSFSYFSCYWMNMFTQSRENVHFLTFHGIAWTCSCNTVILFKCQKSFLGQRTVRNNLQWISLLYYSIYTVLRTNLYWKVTPSIQTIYIIDTWHSLPIDTPHAGVLSKSSLIR